MLQWPALGAGKDGLIDGLGVLGGAEDEAGPGATQRLMGSAGDHLRVRHRRGINPASYQPGKVRHVHQEERPDLIRNGAERSEVDDAGVSAAARDDELGPLLAGLL